MILPSRRLTEFEARYQREAFVNLTFEQALARFTALWVEARVLNPTFGADWANDLGADFAVARAVNDLPPST